MKRIYLSGPITKLGERRAELFTRDVSEISGHLVEQGWAVYNPYGSVIASRNWGIRKEVWLKQDFEWIKLCDAICMIGCRFQCEDSGIPADPIDMLPWVRWHESEGACAELEYARKLGLDLHEWTWDKYVLKPLTIGGD